MKAQGTYLEKFAERAKAELPAKKKQKPLAILTALARAAPRPPPFEASVRKAPPVRVVAEIKRRTPARFLDRDLDVAECAKEFTAGGACALVIPTEAPLFAGTMEDLALARKGSNLPLVRRDALLDPWQLAESRVAGASAVLLVPGLLEGKALPEMLRGATELGLEAIVQVHDDAELDRALDSGAAVVSLELRDPASHAVDFGLAGRLAPKAGRAGTLVLAQSGIETPEQARQLVDTGVDAVVAGTALVLAGDRADAVRRLVAAS